MEVPTTVRDARLESWIRIVQCAGLTPRHLHALLREFGSPEGILRAPAPALGVHVPPEIVDAIRAPQTEQVEATLEWAEADGNHLLTWEDPRYPRSLLELTDPPPMLFCKGDPARLNAPSLAMVGSRNASPGGIRTAEEFAEAFALSGVEVVSGLALGIDAASHRGALKTPGAAASTIAVIGTGIDRVYPPRNRDLAHAIATHGAIVSEFPLGTPPLAFNFPRRNRLISGLARGVLVVEAAPGSGSLITARFAGEQGKEVFAIPGSIHSPFSKGCHQLIRQGAKLVETAQDVLEELRLPMAVSAASPARSNRSGKQRRKGDDPAAPESTALLDAIAFDPVTPDDIAARTGWPIERILSMLLQLELDGSIARTAGDRIQRLH